MTTKKQTKELTKEQRKEKVLKAIKLMEEGKELLEEAGFKLIFDMYENCGAYAVPAEVDFPDDCDVETGECDKSFDDLIDAGEFLCDCPIAIEIDGLYNDGTRLVDNIPSWWKGWKKFIEKKE
jgi:hypothetical protein